MARRKASGPGPETHTLSVRFLMRRDFVTVPPEEFLHEALRLMRFARLRHLLVEENGYLVGIVSYRDLQEERVAHLERIAGQPPGDARVASAMHRKPYAVTPDTSLRDAAKRLCNLRLGCLPVVERQGDRPALVGIVTELDLLRAAYQVS